MGQNDEKEVVARIIALVIGLALASFGVAISSSYGVSSFMKGVSLVLILAGFGCWLWASQEEL